MTTTSRGLRSRLAGIAMLAVCALASAAHGLEGPAIEIGMAPQEATVGDRVVVEISVIAPAASQTPVFPSWSSGRWGRLEVLEVGDVRQAPADPGLRLYSQRLVVTAFETGEIELPPISIELPHARNESQIARSDARVLRVRSVRSAAADAGADPAAADEPRPPAGLHEIPLGSNFWWTLGLLSLACALVAAWLLRADPSVEIVRPRLDPLDEFDQLVRGLDREADPVAFHTRLSFALRHFLGRTLGFGGIESTTTEIQRRLRQHQLAGETVRHTSQLLRDCDQVKFARVLAGQQSSEETLGEAGRIARRVYHDIRPQEPHPTTGGDPE